MPTPYPRRPVRALAALVAGGVLLTPGAALAAAPTVTFSGGCGVLGLGASSRPDVSSISVPTGGTVHFVNHLGESAALMVDGTKQISVPDDYEVAATFPHAASVTMVPGCLLGHGAPGAVAVNVSAPPASGPARAGTPPVGGRSSASPAGRPTSTKTAGQVPAVPGDSPTADEPSSSAGPPDASVSPDVALPAMPLDSASQEPALAGDPADPTIAVGSAVPATPAKHGPAGTLVLIAVVCVVGVSIAAIRAIIAQRAIRAAAA